MSQLPDIFNNYVFHLKWRHYLLLFLLFFAITFLIYLPALHSKFVADFIDMVFYIQHHPPLTDFSKGILFDFTNRFVFQTWLTVFGYNAWAWHFLQCFLHALNGILFYALLTVVLRQLKYNQYHLVSLGITLCFLLSPYHTEAVNWGGDLNYLLVTCFIFTHLLAFVLFLQKPKTSYLFIAVFALIAGAFTHEWGWLAIPADVVMAFAFAPSLREVFTKTNFKFWGAMVVIMVAYFANKLYSGNLVGHYGSEVHLRFHLKEILSAFYKYLIKIILLGGFIPLHFLQKIYGFIDRTRGILLFTIVLLVIALVIFRAVRKNAALKLPIGFFLLFAMFIFPVLNLYFPYWIKIDGDRYCYITSAFLLASVISTLYVIRPVFSLVFSSFYLIASVCFLLYNIQSWHQAGNIAASLEKEFHWQNAQQVYILNLPDDYRGAYIYRSLNEPNLFVEGFIKYGKLLPDVKRITPVIGYNLNQPTDSVNVQVLGTDSLRVTLSTWGNWWWQQTNSTGLYMDSLANIHIDDYNHSYTVKFKHKQPGDVFLYTANGHWREVAGF